ncbi:GNAT family N-acetyltransferase [Kineococcus glutinatus]|uniref:N-acetyltransferase domain-containing protein n=1 Tax=Kineococcus glutinatus TaxID=1070872 RepID=A0ABP9HR37_9ACTN
MPDAADLLDAYDALCRTTEVDGFPPGTLIEVDDPLVRVHDRRRGFLCTPPDLRLDGPAVDALIERQRDVFAARGTAVEWKHRSHDLPADLPERLLRAGFVAEEPETVLVAEVADVLGLDAQPPAGVVLRQVCEEADLVRVAALESLVWGEDRGWLVADLRAACTAAVPPAAVFTAEADGEVVAAAWLVEQPGSGFAGLWGGSTHPAWRGRGVYRSLVAARARLAAQRGVRWLQVDASADSRPVLERLGFTAVTTVTAYVWTPQASPGATAAGDEAAGTDEVAGTDPALLPVLAELREREPLFHRPAPGAGADDLERQVDPGFWEVGASGRCYSRGHVLEVLRRRAEDGDDGGPWETSGFACRELGPGTYLLTYLLRQGGRFTRRATIWRRTPAGWQVLYHQGTPVAG